MKKTLLILLFFTFIIFITIVGYYLHQDILNFLFSLDISNTYFLFIYFFICLIYFLLPLPVTFIILLNGYFFKEIGFLISMIYISISSILLFFLSKSIVKNFNINLNNLFLKKNINLEKFSLNSYSIFISRYIIPFFFHNLYYGLTSVNFKRFFLVIFLSEIPMTFAISSIGMSIKHFTTDTNINIQDLFFEETFYLPLLIIIFIFFFIKYIKKKL